MKKFLLTISLVTALCFNVNAQIEYNNNTQNTDGFFSTATPSGNFRDGTAGEGSIFPELPGMGLFYDQYAVPVGSGILLLAGMGIAYAVRKRNEKFTLNNEESAMIEENFKLVYAGWHRLKQKYPFLDESELYDACIDAIIYAVRNYDESKGTLSNLFFINAKSNALKNMEYWNAKKREGNFSINENFENSGEEESFIDHYLCVEDEYGFIDMDVIKRMFSVLTKREKEIMYKFVFEEMQKKEIADDIGVSPNTVGRDIIAAKEKIKSKLEGAG